MEDSMDPLLWIILLLLLVAADAMQMAFYAAVSGISDSDLEPDEDGRCPIPEPSASRVRQICDNPRTLLRSVWFWQILTAAEGAVVLGHIWRQNLFLAAFVLTLAVYVFGTALPFLAGKLSGVKAARLLVAPCRLLTAVTVPFTLVLSYLAQLPMIVAGVDPRNLEDEVTEDEILSMVNEGHEQGAIDGDEAEMISNIFELDDKQAHDIMTYRGMIDALDASTPLDDAIRHMTEAANSRFPVFEGSIDNITGALYLKDAVLFHLKEQYGEQSIGTIPHLLREVKFIPETMEVDELFRQMQESRKQMAIVVNEYGETSGIVTMEDILEEIVGNILDEYDHEEKLIARVGEAHFRMNGRALLDDVGKALEVSVDQDHYDTLSGYLTEKLGHIPTAQDRGTGIEDETLGYRFRILSINGTMIGWLDVSRLQAQ